MATYAQRQPDRATERTAESSFGGTLHPALNARSAVTQAQAVAAQLNARSDPVQRKPSRSDGLPDPLRASMEAMSGFALDDVRVHRNSDKPAQMQAHAYAQGTDIHLAPGQEKHLPHEAWHVVQQKQGRVRATGEVQRVAINDDPALEAEADRMGKRAVKAARSDASFQRPMAQRRVVQRATKVHIRSASNKTAPGTISGITFGSRPSSNSTKQGQHLTAYAAIKSMVESHIVDLDPIDACYALIALLPDIKSLINPNTTKTYLFDWLEQTKTILKDAIIHFAAKDAKGSKLMASGVDKLLTTRNQIPGTAKATTNTGGHGEDKPNALLLQKEHYLRRNKGAPDPTWGTPDEAAGAAGLHMWQLMDGNPIKGATADVIAQELIRHMKQMQLSFPKVFEWLSSKPKWYLRPLLSSGDATLPVAALDGSKREKVIEAIKSEGW